MNYTKEIIERINKLSGSRSPYEVFCDWIKCSAISIQNACRCPSCGKMDSKIIDTRMENGYRKRKRECLCCGARWSTIEVRMKEDENVHKAD